MPPRIAKTASLYAGLLLLLIGGLTFLPNPLAGPEGFIATDSLVRYVYIAVGLILLASSAGGEGNAAFGLYMMGALNIALAVLCYLLIRPSGSTLLLDTMKFTSADMIFQVVLGIGFLVCGKMNTSRQQLFYN